MSEQLDAEMSVLGSMMIDPTCITDVQGILNDKDFADQRHRLIFKAITSLYEDGKFNTVTENGELVLLKDELTKTGNLDNSGGIEYLVSVASEVPSAANVEHYSEIVSQTSQMTRVASELTNASRTALEARTKPGELVTALCGKLEGIVQTGSSGDIGFSACERAWQLCEGEFPPAIPSGFRSIDSFTGGWEAGGLTVLAARPSMGKTAMAVQLAANLLYMERKVGFFSVEMPKIKLMDRMLQLISEVNIKSIKEYHREGYGHLITDEQKKALQDASVFIDGKKDNIWVDDTCGLTVDQIESRMCQKGRQCDVLFIDHLGELNLNGDNTAYLRGDAVRRIRNVGKKHGHHTILLAQLNRGNTSRPDKRPYMSDLEGSGGIEQSADNCFLLHRKDYYHKNEPGYVNDGKAEIIVDKSRDGETGVKTIDWLPEFTKFKE